jgi:hypothetical protein
MSATDSVVRPGVYATITPVAGGGGEVHAVDADSIGRPL